MRDTSDINGMTGKQIDDEIAELAKLERRDDLTVDAGRRDSRGRLDGAPARGGTVKPFCAICVAETWDLVQRPLGRDGALVNVCHRCDDEHPRHGGYNFGGGHVPGRENALGRDGKASTSRPRMRR